MHYLRDVHIVRVCVIHVCFRDPLLKRSYPNNRLASSPLEGGRKTVVQVVSCSRCCMNHEAVSLEREGKSFINKRRGALPVTSANMRAHYLHGWLWRDVCCIPLPTKPCMGSDRGYGTHKRGPVDFSLGFNHLSVVFRSCYVVGLWFLCGYTCRAI